MIKKEEEATTTTKPINNDNKVPMPPLTLGRKSQPLSIKDERKLAERYAAIKSVEERAFQILIDLGMITLH